MKINTIISRYVFLELLTPFGLNLVFFTFVFLMTKILDITNLIINYHISLVSVLLMLMFSMPDFLEFVLPMSVMLAILLTFLRLSSDNEIIALKAGGVSIYGMLPPVLAFCLMGCLLTAFTTIYGLPWGRAAIKRMTVELVGSSLDIGLKERTFNDSFKDVMLYVNQIDAQNKTLIDVFIEDQRSQTTVSTVVAPRGRLFSDPRTHSVHLRLFDGSIHQVDLQSRAVHLIDFDTYEIALDIGRRLRQASSGPKDEREMSLGELRHYLQTHPTRDAQYHVTHLEYHRKFSIPAACFVLGLLAVPLGVQSRGARRSYGLGLGLFFFLLYYVFLMAGLVFGEAGVYPPLVGMWLPNGVMGAIAVVFFVRTARERNIGILLLPLALKRKLLQRMRAFRGPQGPGWRRRQRRE